jgi:predicted Zn-dependent protease
MFINWLNDVVAERAYSRKLEMEADAVGLDVSCYTTPCSGRTCTDLGLPLQLMAAAGYDPRAAVDLWELMACVEADAAAAGQPVSVADRFALLRTHPASIERQKALELDMPGAMELWRESMPKSRQADTPKAKTSTASLVLEQVMPVEATDSVKKKKEMEKEKEKEKGDKAHDEAIAASRQV